MFPFLYPREKKNKNTLVCFWPGTESIFLGHCWPAQEKKKKFLFQVEKQGVSSWSDLSSCWLLSEAQNASHLDISRCRRKFLHQQLLKMCNIDLFIVLSLNFNFIFLKCRSEAAGDREEQASGKFCFVFFIFACLEPALGNFYGYVWIAALWLVQVGQFYDFMPTKYVDFGEGTICRLKIHEWALKKTCNLIAFPSPLVPLWRKSQV